MELGNKMPVTSGKGQTILYCNIVVIFIACNCLSKTYDYANWQNVYGLKGAQCFKN